MSGGPYLGITASGSLSGHHSYWLLIWASQPVGPYLGITASAYSYKYNVCKDQEVSGYVWCVGIMYLKAGIIDIISHSTVHSNTL